MQCSQCDRLVARSQPLADLIWKRLLPLMTRDDVAEVRPFGFGAEGVWQPLGINDVIRFTRCVFIDVPRNGLTLLSYSPGGHFQMHRDGAFVLNDEIRRSSSFAREPNAAQTPCATRSHSLVLTFSLAASSR